MLATRSIKPIRGSLTREEESESLLACEWWFLLDTACNHQKYYKCGCESYHKETETQVKPALVLSYKWPSEEVQASDRSS